MMSDDDDSQSTEIKIKLLHSLGILNVLVGILSPNISFGNNSL